MRPPHSVMKFGPSSGRKLYDLYYTVQWGFAEVERHPYVLSLISPSFGSAAATPVIQLIITNVHPPTAKTFVPTVSHIEPQLSPWPSMPHNQNGFIDLSSTFRSDCLQEHCPVKTTAQKTTRKLTPNNAISIASDPNKSVTVPISENFGSSAV